MSERKLVLTIEEIQKSKEVKAWIAQLLAHKVFAAVLDTLQRQALPSATVPSLVPGVHHDTTLAHDDRYRAGWSDAINAIRKIPTGDPLPPPVEEEELWSGNPAVLQIDQEIERLAKSPRQRRSTR